MYRIQNERFTKGELSALGIVEGIVALWKNLLLQDNSSSTEIQKGH